MTHHTEVMKEHENPPLYCHPTPTNLIFIKSKFCELHAVPKSSGATGGIHFPVSPSKQWKLGPRLLSLEGTWALQTANWDPSGMTNVFDIQSNLTYLNTAPQGRAQGQFTPTGFSEQTKPFGKQLKNPYLSV